MMFMLTLLIVQHLALKTREHPNKNNRNRRMCESSDVFCWQRATARPRAQLPVTRWTCDTTHKAHNIKENVLGDISACQPSNDW